jgi:uncharacterized protein (TIGR02246 family)
MGKPLTQTTVSLTRNRFYTPQEAEAAFYAAFIRRDLEAMMTVWAEDDDIVCIQPHGDPLSGRAAIRASWEAIFRRAPDMHFIIEEKLRVHDGQLAVHVVHEHIRAGEETPPSVHTTNAYRLTDKGWRMVLHHATPEPPPAETDTPTLH